MIFRMKNKSLYFKKRVFSVLFLMIIFCVGIKGVDALELGFLGDCRWYLGDGCGGGGGGFVYKLPPIILIYTCGSAAKIYPYGSPGYGTDNFCDLSLTWGTSAPVVASFDPYMPILPSFPPSFPSPGSSVSWMCDSTVACSASQAAMPVIPIDGTCGNADKIVYPSASSAYTPYTQCSSGTPSNASFPSAGNTVTWTCSGIDGGSASPTCSASRLSPVPTVDLKINGSDGPVPLSFGDTRTITWTSTDATSCEATSSDGFAGPKSISSGSTPELRGATATSDHTLTCTGPGGSASDSVQVNVSCTPITGVYGACDCPTETKTRTNTLVSCLPSTETTACDSSEKNACRDYNWKEIAP